MKLLLMVVLSKSDDETPNVFKVILKLFGVTIP